MYKVNLMEDLRLKSLVIIEYIESIKKDVDHPYRPINSY